MAGSGPTEISKPRNSSVLPSARPALETITRKMQRLRSESIDVIVLPANQLQGDWGRGGPIEGFDMRMMFRVLETRGFRTELINLNPSPLNPLAGKHPLWRALDPLRALRVL